MKNQMVVSTYSDSETPSCYLPKDWWEKTEAWAKILGVPPNEISGRFKTKPKGLINSNGYDLARYRTRFGRELDASNIENIGLTRLAFDWRYKALDWDFEADYGYYADSCGVFLMAIDLECLRKASRLSPFAFAQEVERRSHLYLTAQYGFAIVMPRDFMPSGYALGVAAGELPYEMNMDANAWMRYENGKPSSRGCDRTLRNVYGYNILNSKHLDISVGGQRLEDWIRLSTGRGRIEPLDGRLFLWTFQKGDDQEAFLRWDYPAVVAVREELRKFKIFPWQRLAANMRKPC